MAKLPTHGWLQRCEECEKITSRIVIIEHKNKTYLKYSCLMCRKKFIQWLFKKFNHVIIIQETIPFLVLEV